jgi:N-acetylneuraminic acid mutarotase
MRKNVLRTIFAIPFILILLLMSSCKSDDSSEDLVGNWINRYSFEGNARSHAVSFTLDDKAYVVSGYDGDERVRLQDTWEFNPVSNRWTKKANFPGAGRTSAIAFAANGKGYVGTGYDGNTKLKDFWEYDPTLDTWTQKCDFGGSTRYGAVAFSIGSKGYVLGGYDGNYLKDLWEYDPLSNTWTTKTSLPGNKRFNALSFAINDIAYIVGGNNNGSYINDFWAYNASNDTWEKKRDIADNSDYSYDDDYGTIARQSGVAFVINGLGYLATGDISSLLSNVWEYDPITDLWVEKASFEGTTRNCAIGFSVQNRGYVLLGKSSSLYFDDIWEFEPFAEYNEND